MNDAFSKILDVIIGALNLFRFWIVLDEYERGIILRLGKFHKEIGPGFHWRRAFKIDELKFVNIKQKTTNSWDMTFPMDNNSITMSFAALIEVHDSKKVILELDNWDNAAYTTIKIGIAEKVNLLLEADPDIYLETTRFIKLVKTHVSNKLSKIGITLVDFSFQEITKTRAYKLFNGAN